MWFVDLKFKSAFQFNLSIKTPFDLLLFFFSEHLTEDHVRRALNQTGSQQGESQIYFFFFSSQPNQKNLHLSSTGMTPKAWE